MRPDSVDHVGVKSDYVNKDFFFIALKDQLFQRKRTEKVLLILVGNS